MIIFQRIFDACETVYRHDHNGEKLHRQYVEHSAELNYQLNWAWTFWDITTNVLTSIIVNELIVPVDRNISITMRYFCEKPLVKLKTYCTIYRDLVNVIHRSNNVHNGQVSPNAKIARIERRFVSSFVKFSGNDHIEENCDNHKTHPSKMNRWLRVQI